MIYTESLRYSIGARSIASTRSISTLHLLYLKVLSADYYGSHYATFLLVAFFSKNSRCSQDSRIKGNVFSFLFNVLIRDINFGNVEKFNQLTSLTETRSTHHVNFIQFPFTIPREFINEQRIESYIFYLQILYKKKKEIINNTSLVIFLLLLSKMLETIINFHRTQN